MKKFLVALTTSLTLISGAALADRFPIDEDTPFLTTHERILINLCEAVASGNRMTLHKAMKEARVSYKELQHDLECNGTDPVTFAMLSGAKKTAMLIAKRNKMDTDALLASR